MSEFLFIIPAGWTQMPADTIDRLSVGITAVQVWVSIGNMSELTLALQGSAQITLDQNVVEARLFNGDMLVVRLSGN